MITIVLIENHLKLRAILRASLEAQPDFSVIGEAAEGILGVELVVDLQPDVVITAFAVPGLNGLEFADCISLVAPRVKVILFSNRDDPAYMTLYAKSQGLLRFISKFEPLAALYEAIRTLCAPLAG